MPKEQWDLTNALVVVSVTVTCVVFSGLTFAEEAMHDLTCFQTGAAYAPEIDIGSDMAIVYGINDSYSERAAKWREQGYAVGVMTGIAWGGYDAYFVTDGRFKKEEVQTLKDGSLRLHNPDSTCGYNVPTQLYIAYMKTLVEKAISAGAEAVFLEEPEYWADTGWSEAFKREWVQFYGEPWQAPDSSVDAQYRASKLKYELYFRALEAVFADAKAWAAKQGRSVECVVPTHSLINYAHWGIVSPESHLVDIPELDGYIAQVWTGTARTPNVYCGVAKERTFETAFFEYGQMAAMVRPAGRKVWFLADPVEDNPNRSWSDYKRNYECTVVASLMWPDVHRFEVMPWPSRIFRGRYPNVDLEKGAGRREGIPAEYATRVLIAINALNEMDQPDVECDTGTRGIGVVVSDTMMFQRAQPYPSDRALGAFYGLALPLLKHGVPVEVVQLENMTHPDRLAHYKVLLVTYEHQKPLRPEYHEVLSRWVREGGSLIFIDDGSDPYQGVREWWNEQGKTRAKASEDLMARLGINTAVYERPQRIGKGYVLLIQQRPSDLQRSAEGAEHVRRWVSEILAKRGEKLRTQNYLRIQRGPFVVAAVLDESVSEEPLVLKSSFVNLFDPSLPVLRELVLRPGERALLYDLQWARKNGISAKVVAAGTRVRNETLSGNRFTFVARGPKATTATARVLLPRAPVNIATSPVAPVEYHWDNPSRTAWLSFPNLAQDVTVLVDI